MWISEQILYRLVKLFSNSEVGHSDEHKSSLENEDAYAEFRLQQIDLVLDAAKRYGVSIEDKIVLDLGCFDGAISVGYLEKGARKVIGVDIDEAAVAKAKELRGSDTAEFYASTIDGIPLPDESVEVILCYDVFEHVERPPEMLKEIKRILKPGGRMLIGTWGWKHPFAPHLWSTMPVPWAHVMFSERTMLRTCRRVYESDWYQPNMHDFDENGERIPVKYDYEEIPGDYLNKYLIKDFERDFKASGLDYKMHLQPFGSRYAAWSKMFLGVPWVREFITGYLWCELFKPAARKAVSEQPAVTTASA